ncbi:VCX1 [Symbiodinium natans]|uniref:VCX1 protein n=1 Tax=Symbiodinium natans TaxID=878477 RepID=A0A812RJ38_9DINO|nr:VCX1 [Symbiodinium natans]
MALHADFKNRGGLQGLQGLFNPKAGKKVFAASLDSVLPDARSQKLASTGGKLPVLQAARAQDPLKSESPGPPVAPGPTPEPEPVEPRKWSRVFQNAVQSLVKQVHQVSDDSKPQEKTLEPEIEDKHEAPAMTSTLSEPKPPEQQKSPDARMRRVLARARLPAKQPERIEEIKNIEVFAERLVDAYGSLTLAFQAFDSHGRSEVTRSQFDAALDALGLDIPELCDIPASKLFSLVSRASKKPIGALTEQAWTAFFKKYLEKTASAHLLDADVNIQAALSQLAELHRLQPRRDYGRQDNQGSEAPPRRWGVVAAAVLDDEAMAKLAIFEDVGESKKSSETTAGSSRRRAARTEALETERIEEEDADASGSAESDIGDDSDVDIDATKTERTPHPHGDQADSAAPRHGLHGHASSGAGTDAAGDGADGISPGSGSGVGHGTSDPTNDSDDQNPQHPQHPHARRLAQVEEETDSVSGAGVKVAGMDGSSDGRDMSRSTAARDPGKMPSTSGSGHFGLGGSGSSGSGANGNGSFGPGSSPAAGGMNASEADRKVTGGRVQDDSRRHKEPSTHHGQASSHSGRNGDSLSGDTFGSGPSELLSAGTGNAGTGDQAAGENVFRRGGHGDQTGVKAKDRRAGRTGLSGSVSAAELDGGPMGSESFSGVADESRKAYHTDPHDLLAGGSQEEVAQEDLPAKPSWAEGGEADVTSGLKVFHANGKAEETSDSEVDDEISSIEEEKPASDLQSLVKQVFRLYATGYSKGQYVFIRNPDLARFMEDAKEALPGHRKKFRRFKRIFESIFDDTIQLQCDMPGQGMRITAGLTLDWFQVFVQKAVRRVGTEVMGFFMALLEAQGC